MDIDSSAVTCLPHQCSMLIIGECGEGWGERVYYSFKKYFCEAKSALKK